MRSMVLPFCVLLLLSSCAKEKMPEATLSIRNVNIIDLETFTVSGLRQVVVDNDRIVYISEPGEEKAYSAEREYDANGGYLIPGLWDMHAHPDDPELWRKHPGRSARDLLMPLFVLYGVTGIRDMGGSLEEVKHWRAAEQSDSLLAPRIFAAGPLLDGPDPMWDGSVGIDAPQAVPEIIDSLLEAGVDFLKVYSLLPEESFRAVGNYAREKNIPVVGHVPVEVTPTEAAAIGLKSQEHFLEILKQVAEPLPEELKARIEKENDPLNRYIMANEYRLNHINTQVLDSVLGVFVLKNTWHCPTLSMWYKNAWYEEELEKDRPQLTLLPGYMKQYWSAEENDHLRSRDREDFLAVKRELYEFYELLVVKMKQAGVGLLAGTDTGANPLCFPGLGVHHELKAMVDAGLTPGEALRTATVNPAIFLDVIDRYGRVAKGYKADLVILVNNPLDKIENLRQIQAVIREGRFLGGADIDKMKAEIILKQGGE